MASAVPKFRLFGIPVRVDPFFVVILLVLGFAMYSPFGLEYVLSFAGIAAGSILFHEMGHALAFKSYGIQPSVLLYGMGGVTTGSGRLTPSRNILITLAGPLPPLLLIGLPAWLVLQSPGHNGQLFPTYPYTHDIVLQQIVFVNVIWSLLNLVPVLPLDGGLVSASVFELLVKGRGRQIANVISLVVVGLLVVWALSVGEPFLLVFGAFLGFVNIRELTQRGAGASGSAADPLTEAHRALLHGQPQMAEYLAQQAVAEARDLEQQRWAHELLAWARLFVGDVAGAEQQSRVMAPSRPPSQSFFASLALFAGRRNEGITLLAWAFVHEPAGPPKSLAAVAVARTAATDELAHELRAMGREGAEALRLLPQLLDYAGYHDEAKVVTSGVARPPIIDHQTSDDWPSGGHHLPSPPATSPAAPPTAGWPAPPRAPSGPPAGPPSTTPSAWPSQPPAGPPSGPSPWQRPSEH